MLEIVCKILFFLSMLVVYINVTSTSSVIVIVLGYVVCVFSYYYFNNIQGIIDEWLNYFNFGDRLQDTMNPSDISGYFLNRKYGKINNGSIPSVGGKKLFGPLCNAENSFSKENNLLETCTPSMLKTDYKNNGELPSPILKNGSPVWSNRPNRDKLKINFNAKSEVPGRKNVLPLYGSSGSNRRCDTNLDMKTYANVNSPGFTSRVVDKAAESASFHIKYPAVRHISSYKFDKSTLRRLSKMPKANTLPTVRIAPPEPTSMNLLNSDTNLEAINEDVRGHNFLQVLKDISRKRNYTQEETDRTGSMPKKSRKTDAKNVLTSQYKRSHDNCFNDSPEDKSRKKRCDDTDRNYAKMMSYTSSMSVIAPEFSWDNNTKKRKSCKIDKHKGESPEKTEKHRKISEEETEEIQKLPPEVEVIKPKLNNQTYVLPSEEVDVHVKSSVDQNTVNDKIDAEVTEIMPLTADDDDYVRVAGGKILNRSNCTYRKKLNSSKIDPVLVISSEPEYVVNNMYLDDKTMKENLLNNLINDIERKDEKNDSVVFYQNSIVEEIEKSVTNIEIQQPEKTTVITSSLLNPLAPVTKKPAVNDIQFGIPATSANESTSMIQVTPNAASPVSAENIVSSSPVTSVEATPSFTFGSKISESGSVHFGIPASSAVNSSLFNPVAFNSTAPAEIENNVKTAPLTSTDVTPSFTFGKPTDTVDFSKLTTAVAETPKQESVNPPGPLDTVSTTTVVREPTSNAVSVLSSVTPALTTSASSTSSNTFQFGQANTTVATASTNNNSGGFPVSNLFNVVTSAPTVPTSSPNTFSLPSTSAPLQTTTAAPLITTFQFGQSNVTPATSNRNPLFNASSTSANAEFKFGASQLTVTTTPAFGNITSPSTFSTSSVPAFSATHTFGTSEMPSFGGSSAPLSFNTTTTASTFASAPSFVTSNQTPTFNFGSQSLSSSFGTKPTQPAPLFGSPMPTNSNPPSLFTNTQTNASQTPMFGSIGPNNSSFGSNTEAPTQTTPNQPFMFGSVQPTTTTAAFPTAPSFGTTNQAPTFNFGSQTSSSSTFGANQAQPPSVFGSSMPTNSSQPALFTNTQPNVALPPLFGAGGQSAQFFGSNTQTTALAVPNQPFMFGSTANAPANTGGFSIGSGGTGTRNRAMARSRKIK